MQHNRTEQQIKSNLDLIIYTLKPKHNRAEFNFTLNNPIMGKMAKNVENRLMKLLERNIAGRIDQMLTFYKLI